MTTMTINLSPHWEGMADFYERVLFSALCKSKTLSKDANVQEWLDTAIQTINYAYQIRLGLAECNCGCADD